MSDKVKGARKPKKGQDNDSFKIGKSKVKYDLLIAVMVAAFYALSLLAATIEGGVNAVLFSVIVFVAFVVFAWFVRAGTVPALKSLRSLIFVFLGLSALSLAWQLLLYFGVLDAGKLGQTGWIVAVGSVISVVSIAIIAILLYFEKDSLKDMYLRLGDRLNIAMGVFGFILCLVLAVVVTYFVFGGNQIGMDRLLPLLAAILAFSIPCGILEELWFRGLLMSKATPIFGEAYGNIYQAAVFGAFEAVMFTTVTGQVADLLVLLMLGAIMGFYWGRSTLRTKSLWSPMLLHAGLYTLILLPILVGLMS
jgi:membrane protease YdiL (CAAX protease family)